MNNWFRIQVSYIPAASHLRNQSHICEEPVDDYSTLHNDELDDIPEPANDPFRSRDEPENIPLYLPSQLPQSLWSTGCISGLHKTEATLRIAQANDALEQLKAHLCVYSGLVNYKIVQVSGPGLHANTHARNLLTRYRDKITSYAERYMTARSSLALLDADGDWKLYLCPLLLADITGPNGCSPHDEPTKSMRKAFTGTGEGYRELSWIWKVNRKFLHPGEGPVASMRNEQQLSKCAVSYVHQVFAADLQFPDLQVEYAKAKARVSRWHKETLLLAEEMRRSVAFLKWKAQWWRNISTGRSCRSDIQMGLNAYSARQEYQLLALAERFARMWFPVLEKNGFDVSWMAESCGHGGEVI